jgi:hypothetical protein
MNIFKIDDWGVLQNSTSNETALQQLNQNKSSYINITIESPNQKIVSKSIPITDNFGASICAKDGN